jgi:uncharacterized small protein (DUF1192 family)
MLRTRVAALFAFGAILFAAIPALAWTGPTGSPPSNNISAPVNVSSTFQDKAGALWADGGMGINSGSAYCIGASCITSWAQAGAGGSMGGSGTAGSIPRFTAGTTLGNSSITSDGVSSTASGNLFVTGVLWAPHLNGNGNLLIDTPANAYTISLGNSNIVIPSSGNVGISNGSPAYPLDVTSTPGGTGSPTMRLNSLNGWSGIIFNSAAEGVGGQQPVGGIFAQGQAGWNSTLHFILNNNWGAPTVEVMTMKNANVGIGNTGPSARLDITPASNGVDTLKVENSTNTHFLTVKPDDGTNTATLGYWVGSGWGTVSVPGTLLVNSQQVCLANGTNCPAAVTSQWTTSGSNIYYNNGAVGIGTNAPVGSLTIQGSLGGWSSFNIGKELLITPTTGWNNPAIGITDANGTNPWAIINSSGDMQFAQMPAFSNNSTPPTFNVVFKASGVVGIGTANPVATQSNKLTIHNGTNQNFNFSGPVAASTGVTINASNDAYNANVPLELRADPLILGMAGNVGIGTISPYRKLEVNNLMKFTNSSSDNNDGTIGTAPFAPGLNIVGINTDGAGRKINEWGSIIQNDNPVGNSFVGTSAFGGTVTFNGQVVSNNGPYTNDWFRVNGNNGIYWQNWGSGWTMTDSTWIRSYGGAGLWMNTAPIGTNGYLTVGYGGGGTNAGGAIIAGNVGIGTNNPQQKLEVNGYVQIDSTNGQGGTITLMGNNGSNSYIENNNGTFRIVNSPWTAELFSVDQAGTVRGWTFLYYSDARLKKDVAPLTDNLSKVLQLKPVSYLWKDPARGAGEQIGFIAQDVQKVVPEIVQTDASTTLEGVDYARMAPLLVGSVQELNAKIDTQQQEIDSLKAELEAIKNK